MDQSAILRLIALLLVASVVATAAIFSVQNATPVVLQFLLFRSVALPIGVALAFAFGAGVVVTAVLHGFWGVLGRFSGDDRAGFEASFEEDV